MATEECENPDLRDRYIIYIQLNLKELTSTGDFFSRMPHLLRESSLLKNHQFLIVPTPWKPLFLISNDYSSN
jgi:hypothetical protein